MSDIRVFATKSSDNRAGIGIRVSASVMKRMRWLHGDFVRANFDDESMSWTIRRVSGPETGNKLSCGGNKDAKAATVRFVVSWESLKQIGLETGSAYECTMDSSDTESAVFKID